MQLIVYCDGSYQGGTKKGGTGFIAINGKILHSEHADYDGVDGGSYEMELQSIVNATDWLATIDLEKWTCISIFNDCEGVVNCVKSMSKLMDWYYGDMFRTVNKNLKYLRGQVNSVSIHWVAREYNRAHQIASR